MSNPTRTTATGNGFNVTLTPEEVDRRTKKDNAHKTIGVQGITLQEVSDKLDYVIVLLEGMKND
jgi:hypothetical protein